VRFNFSSGSDLFGLKDRDGWAKERAQGFWRFWFGKFWPALVVAVAYGLIKRFLLGHGEITWPELVFWSSCVVAGTLIGAGLAWWNRERLFRRRSGGPAPTE
jgi:hypothetical protein